jgi:serine phosphatase RsbU (regulator of sigma subunit)
MNSGLSSTVENTSKNDWPRKELTDSIKYASYIQSALLPSAELLERLIPEHFVFFMPRDLVSGDFYWISRVKKTIIIAVADCTGHGVPGAFMSVMGISFLNEIIGKGCIPNAGSILNQLRERVMKALHQTGQREEQKDGMDISLCMIESEQALLQFAGANNPFYLVRDNHLIEIKGDRMPIGINITTERSFSNHSINLHDGDMVYLITDGYPDQFGGPAEKKFKYKPFKNLLVSIADKSMIDQQEVLKKTLIEWRGNIRQVDDILILGVRFITKNKGN